VVSHRYIRIFSRGSSASYHSRNFLVLLAVDNRICLAVLEKLVGNEQQWPWAIERAKTLMRHFGDLRALDGLGDQADYSLSHGAAPLAAEQALADIGTFEVERGCQAVACALVKPSVRRPRFGCRGRVDAEDRVCKKQDRDFCTCGFAVWA
jgi:hypothetical protein